jgi:hypothetical protein
MFDVLSRKFIAECICTPNWLLVLEIQLLKSWTGSAHEDCLATGPEGWHFVSFQAPYERLAEVFTCLKVVFAVKINATMTSQTQWEKRSREILGVPRVSIKGLETPRQQSSRCFQLNSRQPSAWPKSLRSLSCDTRASTQMIGYCRFVIPVEADRKGRVHDGRVILSWCPRNLFQVWEWHRSLLR